MNLFVKSVGLIYIYQYIVIKEMIMMIFFFDILFDGFNEFRVFTKDILPFKSATADASEKLE